eukprot:scaffold44059_cov19-Tisochrysis_lutea.AAC.4
MFCALKVLLVVHPQFHQHPSFILRAAARNAAPYAVLPCMPSLRRSTVFVWGLTAISAAAHALCFCGLTAIYGVIIALIAAASGTLNIIIIIIFTIMAVHVASVCRLVSAAACVTVVLHPRAHKCTVLWAQGLSVRH